MTSANIWGQATPVCAFCSFLLRGPVRLTQPVGGKTSNEPTSISRWHDR